MPGGASGRTGSDQLLAPSDKGFHDEADREDNDPAFVERIVAILEALTAQTFRKINAVAVEAAQANFSD